MLKTLRKIVQEVSSSQELSQALELMVQRVREAMNTQACSVFLIDHTLREYVLAATEGLNPSVIRKLRVRLEEGLVGYVAQRGEPINLEDAPSHPKYLHTPKLKEEALRAFLGVPIIHHGKVLGVLVVQQESTRRFDEAEEAFLVTLSAQLAGVIAHADATGAVKELIARRKWFQKKDETTYAGIASVPGVAIGHAVVVYPPADLKAVPDKQVEDIDAELAAFDVAMESARKEVHRLTQRMADTLPSNELALFDAYIHMLDDPMLSNEIIKEIKQGQWAQGALKSIINKHVKLFEDMDDEYLRERAVDFKDLGRRILSHLQSVQRKKPVYPEQTILIGDEVTAGDLAEVPVGQLAGVVAATGSSNSHVAILARALGVPTVMGVQGLNVSLFENKQLVVDGYYGLMYVEPSAPVLKEFERLAKEEQELEADLDELRELPAETTDGHNISLCVNTGLAADASLSLSVGADGVGLFRTEVPFMIRERFPVEEEQRVIYRQLLGAFSPRQVTMRTLDVGGDKALPYFPVEEENPFLGWRGIRISLDHPEMFLIQVRAMLKASEGFPNLRIMLPMVSGVAELEAALALIEQAYLEIIDEGLDVVKPKIGVMIEIPSAVYDVRALAKRVDFISVGSNDLTQYILAVDRNNSRVASLYDSTHPAVLRALLQTVEGAHAENTHASICGEMAGDPVCAVLLLAMGYDSLSMNSTSLLRMKWVIRKFSMAQARELLQDVLTMEYPNKIRSHVEQALCHHGLGGLIRAGKT